MLDRLEQIIALAIEEIHLARARDRIAASPREHSEAMARHVANALRSSDELCTDVECTGCGRPSGRA